MMLTIERNFTSSGAKTLAGAWRLLTLIAVVSMAGLVGAGAQDAPTLTVDLHPFGGSQEYSIGQLRALPQREIETSTPWTEGVQSFSGVALGVLLEGVPQDATLILRAVNDYTVTIPVSAVQEEVPVVAYERNGGLMSIRDKGPFWLIYPFDADTQYQTETIYARSIWQLVEIRVEE
jgi:hypothetical protein